MKLSVLKLSALSRSQARRRLIFIVAFMLAIAILGTGAFFVYRQPDSGLARRFARFIPYPAAFAGFSPVWANEVFSRQIFTQTYSQKTNQVVPEAPAMRSEILDHIIEIRLVGREASRAGLTVTKEEIESAFDTIAQQTDGGREQILSTLKEMYGMDERDFKDLMADQLLIDKFRKEVLVAVSVRHILVKDQNKANSIAKQLKEGGDFAAIAKEQSEDTGSRDAGGSLGFINRGAAVKPIEEAAFSLPVGQISDPVQSEFGWHVILVEERKGTIDKSYADWLAEAKSKTKILKLLKR